jgi:RNA polymerase sigma-70 factor (ECF subfamily)
MYTLCRRILKDSFAAQDTLQDAFLEVFRDIGQFRGEAALGAWIKRIVVRKAVARVRKENRYVPFPTDAIDPQTKPGETVGLTLERALERLPAGARAVLVLVELQDYTHKEAAALLGISEGTSKSQLFQARKILRKILSESPDALRIGSGPRRRYA